MLVLSRQKNEVIIIGEGPDRIEIEVVDVRGDKVRLGVSAPKEIGVHRKEVFEAIRRENREAAQVKPEDIANLGKSAPPPTTTTVPSALATYRAARAALAGPADALKGKGAAHV